MVPDTVRSVRISSPPAAATPCSREIAATDAVLSGPSVRLISVLRLNVVPARGRWAELNARRPTRNPNGHMGDLRLVPRQVEMLAAWPRGA
jgi:hypothetical protein